MHLKLPSSVRMQPTKFDPSSYKIEDPIQYMNEVRNHFFNIFNVLPFYEF